MFYKVNGTTKSFTTLLTFIRFLSSVCYFINSTVSERTEGFTTVLTSIGFLSSMSLFMFLKVVVISEGFSTSFTFIGFLSSVNSFMSLNGLAKLESLPTFLTIIGFLSSVNLLMNVSRLTMLKSLSTFFAFIWLLFIFLILTWFWCSTRCHVPIKEWCMKTCPYILTSYSFIPVVFFFWLWFEIWLNVSPYWLPSLFLQHLYHMTAVKNKKHIINEWLINYIY